MRSTLRLGSVAILLVATSMGCTIRYSQVLVGEIARVSTSPMRNSDTGTEVGIGGPGSPPAVIAFSEPMSSDELMTVPCEVAFAQIDYRGKYYAYYIAANFPEVEVISYCTSP
jgi:hypothetical protein